MKNISGIQKGLFDGVLVSGAARELLDLVKLSDDDLYRSIGSAARETHAMFSHGQDYLNNLNTGDAEGKSPFFFRHAKVEVTAPSVCLSLPDDDRDAGEVICDQLGATLDRIVCGTVSDSPLYGYKQEAVKLGSRCVEAIANSCPGLDMRIVKAFVALRTKQLFSFCTSW